jgi:trans-aconitate methyltransferase
MVDVRRFFESRLRRYGDSPRTLDWSPEGQQKRFEVLCAVGDLRGRRVLDVGCGLGHLLAFLRERGTEVDYTGVDLSPKLVMKARKLHPAARFEVLDAVTAKLPIGADFVFASGVLNVETGDNETAMRRLLRALFAACREAVAVNMLSTWADWRDRDRHYFDPVRTTRDARRLTRHVVLRHDYMPHDFTLYLYRVPRR